MALFPFAVTACLVYAVGFPAIVGWYLWKYVISCIVAQDESRLPLRSLPFVSSHGTASAHGLMCGDVCCALIRHKNMIKKDQILRAMGTGYTAKTNPTCYELRARYSRLYYHFKPGKWYWVMVVIGRKCLIAFSSLMYRNHPSFQFSFALIVLFVAFAMHVRVGVGLKMMHMHAFRWERHKQHVVHIIFMLSVHRLLLLRGTVVRCRPCVAALNARAHYAPHSTAQLTSNSPY